jgi:hypothetical protein
LITLSVIDSDVLTKWQTLSLSLYKWNEKFFIARNASDKAPASSEAMEVQETFFQTKALNFNTPAKQKRNTNEDASPAPLLLDVSTYSPFSRTTKRLRSPKLVTSLEF